MTRTHQLIDLRGLACPEPVLRTKQLLDKPEIESIEALVHDEINVQNLKRLAMSFKLNCNWSQDGDFFRVKINRAPNHQAKAKTDANSKDTTAKQIQSQTASQTTKGTVVLINKDTFGEGDRDFSQNLLNVFLQTIFQAGHRPRAILLANSGVRLMNKNSPFLKILNDFRSEQVEVLACGLCVEFYGLKDYIPVEQVTNMFTISEYLFAAERVISP